MRNVTDRGVVAEGTKKGERESFEESLKGREKEVDSGQGEVDSGEDTGFLDGLTS